MTDPAILERVNSTVPGLVRMLGGELTAIDLERKTCIFEFNINHDFCHSGDIVQGGFVTAMLDSAMTHAVFAVDEGVKALSSLEIKTSYLEASRAGYFRAEGVIIKLGYKTAFLEGRLYNEDGVLTATTSSVAKLSR